MYARFDFISPETGRVLLSTLFDAPQDRLPSKEIAAMLKTLVATKKQLEKYFGKGMVRLSLDGYESSVFWALVLFRPVVVYGKRKSVYTILRDGDPTELQRSDLGVVYEPKQGFLVLDWEEAKNGILADFDKCPSWKSITAKTDDWRRCAESHSWVVPEWVLRKTRFLRDRLWFRPSLTYEDVTVLDVRGIEVIKLEGKGKGTINEAKLLTARSVKFVHHYTTSDKREFRAANKIQKRAARDMQFSETDRARRVERQRLRRKGVTFSNDKKNWKRPEFDPANRNWYLASRIVGQLPTHIGKGKRGKYPVLMTAEESNMRFEHILNAYINNELTRTRWGRVDGLLVELEELLGDSRVPNEFGEWFIWRDHGKHIPSYLAGRK